MRGIENRGSPLAVACCSVPSAQLTNGSVHNLLGLPCLPITGYNSAAGSRFCSCFWFPLILKKKKPSGEWDIGTVLNKSAHKARARVRTGHAKRDT